VSSSEDKYLSELEKAQPCSLQDYVYLAAYHLVFGEEDLATEAIRAGYQYADSKLDVIMPIFDLRLDSKPILEACDLEPIDKSLFLDDILKELSSTSVTTRQRAVRTLGDFYGGKFVTGSKALQAIVKALQHEANSETRTVMIKTLRKDFDYNIDRILNSQDTELVSILQKHGVIDKQVEQTQSSEVGDQVRRKLLAVAILGAVSVLLLMLNPRRSVAFFTMGVGLPIVGSVLVIVGSIIEGPLVGMAVGAIIIGFSVLQVGVKPSEIIYGHSAFQSLVFVLKMLLVGPVTWLVWHLFRHWAMLALIAAGLTGSLLNTLIFRISPFDIGGLFGNWGAILVPTVITLVVGGIWHIEKNG
jgi:uncharacterized membrane protein